ncbi:MAG: O-antigen ligase family protein, partial [Nodosilinea sp.]
IYQPELARLATLQGYGVDQSFSFALTSLRNWQPIGHQNYVAGYLMLVLPLLAAQARLALGWHRWLWLVGLGLGLLNLYTTSSRGGWLAITITGILATGISLLYSRLPRPLALAVGGTTLGLLGLGLLANPRLRQVLNTLGRGDFTGGELSYRVVTNAVGWRMGISQPVTGAGLGSVPLVYQKYRPGWAGRDAELQFQLHSTPAQLWGELGIWGLIVPLALVLVLAILAMRWIRQGAQATPAGLPPVLVWSLMAGLFAFGLISLTDYQLDIPAIAGVITLYLAVLARAFSPLQPPESVAAGRHRWLAGAGLGLALAMTLWLMPAHRAWATASSGFSALTDEPADFDRFANQLGQAHALAPWEPYYPYQLGYHLGEFALQSSDSPPLRQTLLADAVEWFETGNQIVPYQEFGHSNLGWLHIEQGQPEGAQASFARAIALVPAKKGVLFGLGVACLQTGGVDCATEALSLEILRHPALLTSPLWQIDPFVAVYPAVLGQLEQRYGDLLKQAEAAQDPDFEQFLHRARGSLRWWRGDLAAAAEDWHYGGDLQQGVLALATGQIVDAEPWPETPAKYAVLAWKTPDQRQPLLERAWVTQPEDIDDLTQALPPPQVIAQLIASMASASDFDDWLHRTAPSWQPRSERLGFGVLSRHIDGPNPSDFLPRVENIPVVQFFEPLFPSPVFFPALDNALQPYQTALIELFLPS